MNAPTADAPKRAKPKPPAVAPAPSPTFDVIVDRNALLAALGRAAVIATGENSVWISSVVMLDSRDGTLVVRATRFTADYQAAVPVIAVGARGQTAIDAKLLLALVGRLPAGSVQLSATLASASVRAMVGARKAEKIPVFACEDYPAPQVLSGAPCDLPAALLRELLAATKRAMSDDVSRPHMACIQLAAHGDRIVATATDGHRLHRMARAAEGVGTWKTLLPVPVVAIFAAALEKAEGDVRLYPRGRLGLEVGRERWTHADLDTTPPNADAVIGSTFAGTVSVFREELLDAAGAVSTVITRHKELAKIPAVWLRASGDRLAISASDATRGDADDTVAAEVTGAFPDMMVHGAYFIDAVESAPGTKVVLSANDANDPLAITAAGDEGFVAIVMPRRS